MESEVEGGGLPRAAAVALTAARGAVAATLASGALLFLLHGRRDFERLGRPDRARVLLSCAEIAGACLFVFPRTWLAGAVVLLIVLAWAAGFHFALGQPVRGLWFDFAIVAALAAGTRAAASRRQP